MKGTRFEDDNGDEFWDTQGAYKPWSTSDGMHGWLVRPPGCPHPLPIGGNLSGHDVEEHADGTITVEPNPPVNPSNSNSILCPQCGWHGFVEHGFWRKV